MFDLAPARAVFDRPGPVACGYVGPERRVAKATAAPSPLAALDELDYGLVLLAADGHVSCVNQAARRELDASHPLQLEGDAVRARDPRDAAALQLALANAGRGMRKLLTLVGAGRRVGVAIVPLAAGIASHGAGGVLIILAKRQVCEPLSIDAYARAHQLTPAETRVLAALSQGRQPTDIARLQGVAISTVRTQVGSIRQKTGALTIAALVRQVAVLPPLMGTLRSAA